MPIYRRAWARCPNYCPLIIDMYLNSLYITACYLNWVSNCLIMVQIICHPHTMCLPLPIQRPSPQPRGGEGRVICVVTCSCVRYRPQMGSPPSGTPCSRAGTWWRRAMPCTAAPPWWCSPAARGSTASCWIPWVLLSLTRTDWAWEYGNVFHQTQQTEKYEIAAMSVEYDLFFCSSCSYFLLSIVAN